MFTLRKNKHPLKGELSRWFLRSTVRVLLMDLTTTQHKVMSRKIKEKKSKDMLTCLIPMKKVTLDTQDETKVSQNDHLKKKSKQLKYEHRICRGFKRWNISITSTYPWLGSGKMVIPILYGERNCHRSKGAEESAMADVKSDRSGRDRRKCREQSRYFF